MSCKNSVLIIPVGLEHDAVMQSFRHVAANKIYLIDDWIPDDSEITRRWKSRFFEKAWKPMETMFGDRVIREKLDSGDPDKIVKLLCKIIKIELKEERFSRIFINVSTLENLFASMAFLVSGFFDKVTLFSLETGVDLMVEGLLSGDGKLHPEFFEHGRTKGPYSCIFYPRLLSKKFKELDALMLERVKENTSGVYADLFDGEVLDRKNKSTLAKVSNCVSRLEQMGYLVTARRGRGKLVKITKKGILVSVIISAVYGD